MGQLSAGREEQDIGATIVGGQPSPRKPQRVTVPVGLERVLYLAAQDETFREELLRDRTSAARSERKRRS